MKAVLISAVIIFGIFLAVLSQIPIGIEPLTELYFEEHTSLPKSVALNETVKFKFTIRNLEYQKMRYFYNVSAFNETGDYLFSINSGEIILEDNTSITLDEEFTFVSNFNRSRIRVEIIKDLSLENPEFKEKLWWPDPNYPMDIDIHFWVIQDLS